MSTARHMEISGRGVPIRWIAFAIVTSGLCTAVLGQSIDSRIRAYLEASRRDGDGPGIIVASAEGQLANSQSSRIAVLYSYQIGESRDQPIASTWSSSKRRKQPVRPLKGD